MTKTASTTRIYLPWLGEFGSELLKYASIAYADKGEKIVFHEEGKEAIYPNANGRVIIPKIAERHRHCAGSPLQTDIWDKIKERFGYDYEYITPSTTPGRVPMEFFHPEPFRRYDIQADVVLFPRWRHTARHMNWPHWEYLIHALQSNGHSVFAAGTKDMSFDMYCPCAWDYDRELDATICAIEYSKIQIGLMTALQVLALMCEKSPWVILTADGMKSTRRGASPNFQYLRQADHAKVGFRVLPYWGDPQEIVKEINGCLDTQS